MKIKIKNTGTIVPKNLTQYDVGYDLVHRLILLSQVNMMKKQKHGHE